MVGLAQSYNSPARWTTGDNHSTLVPVPSDETMELYTLRRYERVGCWALIRVCAITELALFGLPPTVSTDAGFYGRSEGGVNSRAPAVSHQIRRFRHPSYKALPRIPDPESLTPGRWSQTPESQIPRPPYRHDTPLLGIMV